MAQDGCRTATRRETGRYAERPSRPGDVTRPRQISARVSPSGSAALAANKLLSVADVRLPFFLQGPIVEIPPFMPEVFWPLGAPATPIGSIEAAEEVARKRV